MPIRIKVDEDLPQEVAATLRHADHDARTVSEQGLAGATDEAVWEVVQYEQRCLFTADKGFANAHLHPPGTHPGIVLLRLPRESRAGYIRLTELLIERLDLSVVAGAIVVVAPESVRILYPA